MARDLTALKPPPRGARPSAGSMAPPPVFEFARHVAGVLASALCVLAWAAAGLPAHALGPAAPFTPPAAVAPSAAAGPAAVANAPTIDLSGNPVAADSSSPASSGLAGLRLGKSPMALIDGQWWRPGDRPRGALLAAVHNTGVMLRHADGRIEQLAWPGDGSVVSAVSTAGAARPPQPRTSPAPGNQPMSTPR